MGHKEEELARRWFEEVWNQGRAEGIFEMMDPKAVGHTGTGDVVGPQQWKERFWEPFQVAFKDIHVTVDRAISSEDVVAVRWRASMKHVGALFGIPGDGRTHKLLGSTWLRIEDGRLAEGWDTWDLTGLLVRMGATAEILKQVLAQ